jgi:hypothetical protein
MLDRVGLGPDINRRVLQYVEAANLIKPKRVIDMIVREEDAVTPHNASGQHLLTKVWRRIDQNRSGVLIRINPADCTARP